MKKIISVLLLLTTVTLIFSGCGESTGDPDAVSGSGNSKGAITLTYANWNFGTDDDNIERQMIKAFEEQNNVTVKRVENSDPNGYDASLAALAAASKMPDVAAVTNLPGAMENDWMLDISELIANDADWAKIPEVLKKSTVYDGKTYAIPSGYYLTGYYANDDLFNTYNINKLKAGFSYDEFIDAVKKLTSLNKGKESTVGLLNEINIIDWYASSKNEAYGWFSWDGSKYNLDSPEFKEGVEKAKEIHTGKYSYDSLDDTQRAALASTVDTELWNAGKVGLMWQGTWETSGLMALSDFNKRFVGVPNGKACIVADFLAVSPSSRNKEMAYKFAKWMSFDPEGIKKRLELDPDGEKFNSLPLTTDQSVIDAYFERGTFPGIKEAFDNISSSTIEGVKIIEGYRSSRWEAKTNIKIPDVDNANIGQILDAARFGSINYNDFSTQINTLANKTHEDTVKKINQKFE